MSNFSINYEPYVDKLVKEPFDFYGGNYYLSNDDKAKITKDRILRFYEARMIEMTMKMRQMKEEMEQLIWMNESSDSGLIEAKKKLEKRKTKLNDQKVLFKDSLDDQRSGYEQQIRNLKKELQRIHVVHQEYEEYNELILSSNKSAITLLQNQVDTYRK